MFWFVTLIVLAVLAWFLFRMLRRNSASDTARTDPLEHDRGGLNQPLPGQRAATEGEVHDASRSHVGGHVETGMAAADAAAGGRPLDAATAARAARESADTGGTGAAVLAGIATTAAVGAGASRVMADDARGTDDAPDDGTGGEGAAHVERTDPATGAGTGTGSNAGIVTDTAAGSDTGTDSGTGTGPDTGSDTGPDTATGLDAGVGSGSGTGAGMGTGSSMETGSGKYTDPNTPGGSGIAGADTGTASAVRPPEPDLAGTLEFDRPEDGGKTRDPGTATGETGRPDGGVRNDGGAGTGAAAGAAVAAGVVAAVGAGTVAGAGARTDSETSTGSGEAARFDYGDKASNVREMIKILNLRESDASRLGISEEDFTRLWQSDAVADEALVDDVAARLQRMLG